MIIQVKRIHSINRHLGTIQTGAKLVLGVNDIHRYAATLSTAGFSSSLGEGEMVLPPVSFGSVATRNAEGVFIKHKDRPKETVYRLREWHWKQWRGPDDWEECSKLVEVPYKRYPRTHVTPLSIELQIQTTTAGEKIVTTPMIVFNEANESRILHCVNLLLEIFGECLVMTENLDTIIQAPIQRLNWDVLPNGTCPWNTLKPKLQPIIQRQPRGNQPLISRRLETINGFNPDFVAIGRAGFSGYVIFGFSQKGLFVLESLYKGNATYVLGSNWQQISQLSKGEILNNNLHTHRIVHLLKWNDQITALLN